MTDPQRLHDDTLKIVLISIATAYCSGRAGRAAIGGDLDTLGTRLESQAGRLARSAADLAAALEKMRIANAKLALRMAEHKAFFAKYQRPE
jgi:hypothetical protein